MKNHPKQSSEQEVDEKIESRMGLKHKLYNIGGDFDLSLFTESNNQHQRYSNMFPQINEPTLEDSSPKLNTKNHQESELEHYYAEGVTERNTYQKSNKSHSSSKIYMLEMKLDQLTQQAAKKEAQIKKYRKTNEILKTQLEKTQSQLQLKSDLVERQRKEISNLRTKQLSASECQSKNHSLSTKYAPEDNLSSFCAELLSPQETVQILQYMLKKVSKSPKMIKQLKSDPLVHEIVLKLNKN